MDALDVLALVAEEYLLVTCRSRSSHRFPTSELQILDDTERKYSLNLGLLIVAITANFIDSLLRFNSKLSPNRFRKPASALDWRFLQCLRFPEPIFSKLFSIFKRVWTSIPYTNSLASVKDFSACILSRVQAIGDRIWTYSSNSSKSTDVKIAKPNMFMYRFNLSINDKR